MPPPPLFQCINVSDTGVEAIAEHCQDLEILTLSQILGVTNSCIQRVLVGSSQQRLSQSSFGQKLAELTPPSQVTDAGVEAICTNCPKLQRLNLTYCPNITPTCQETLGLKHDHIFVES